MVKRSRRSRRCRRSRRSRRRQRSARKTRRNRRPRRRRRRMRGGHPVGMCVELSPRGRAMMHRFNPDLRDFDLLKWWSWVLPRQGWKQREYPTHDRIHGHLPDGHGGRAIPFRKFFDEGPGQLVPASWLRRRNPAEYPGSRYPDANGVMQQCP